MNKHTEALNDDARTLVEDTRALIHATGEAAEETIVAARKRLTVALDAGKETFGNIRAITLDGAKAAGQVVQIHPYHAVGIAFGAGALLGILLAWRK